MLSLRLGSFVISLALSSLELNFFVRLGYDLLSSDFLGLVDIIVS
jgi:hypothetical protein